VDFEISNMLYPQVTFKSTVVVFVYAVIVAGLASFIPSIRAARVNAVEALRAV
jgi:putative ABC transport system permease protein